MVSKFLIIQTPAFVRAYVRAKHLCFSKVDLHIISGVIDGYLNNM